MPFLLKVLVAFSDCKEISVDCYIVIVATRRRDLIEGMKRIYDTLVSMRYLKHLISSMVRIPALSLRSLSKGSKPQDSRMAVDIFPVSS